MQTKEAPKYIKNIRQFHLCIQSTEFGFCESRIYFWNKWNILLGSNKASIKICINMLLSTPVLRSQNIIYGIHVQCTWVCCILGTVYLVTVYMGMVHFGSTGQQVSPSKSNVQLMNLTANSNCFIMDYAFHTLIYFSVVNIHTLLAIQSNI